MGGVGGLLPCGPPGSILMRALWYSCFLSLYDLSSNKCQAGIGVNALSSQSSWSHAAQQAHTAL